MFIFIFYRYTRFGCYGAWEVETVNKLHGRSEIKECTDGICSAPCFEDMNSKFLQSTSCLKSFPLSSLSYSYYYCKLRVRGIKAVASKFGCVISFTFVHRLGAGKSIERLGCGVLVDAERGLVITSEKCVPSNFGIIYVYFLYAEVPLRAELLFTHPTDGNMRLNTLLYRNAIC